MSDNNCNLEEVIERLSNENRQLLTLIEELKLTLAMNNMGEHSLKGGVSALIQKNIRLNQTIFLLQRENKKLKDS